jgi:hypothetical protein
MKHWLSNLISGFLFGVGLFGVDMYHNQIYQVDVEWNYSVLAHYVESPILSRSVMPCFSNELLDGKRRSSVCRVESVRRRRMREAMQSSRHVAGSTRAISDILEVLSYR